MMLNSRTVGPRLASPFSVAGLALAGTTGAASAGTLTPVHVIDHSEFDVFLADCGDYELGTAASSTRLERSSTTPAAHWFGR